MSGGQLLELLSFSASQRGTDAFSQISGLRYTLNAQDNTVNEVQVLADPAAPAASYVAVDPGATYLVATTNNLTVTCFQALIAGGYKDLFAQAENLTNTEIDINQLVIEYIRNSSPVSAEPDGRVKIEE